MRRITVILTQAGLGAAICAIAQPAAAAELERQPYLQRTTMTETTIVWRTAQSSTGEVRYGPAPDDLGQSVMSPAGTQHEVTLSGLSPATRIYYQVLGDGEPLAGGDALHYVDTNPAVGSRGKVRAWVVGDSGTGGTRQAEVRDAMLAYVGRYRPDLYLHVGDMAYSSGTDSEFTDNFYAPYETILRNVTVWPAMGNHEGASSDSDTQTGPYYEGYVLPIAGEAGGLPSGTEAYYAFDYANVHFVILDSHDSSREPDGPMLTWMQADLQATDQEWIVAYWHHPPYTKGSHDSDSEGALVEMRENALPLLEAAGVDLVLAGHSHIYERSFLLDGAYETPTTAAGIVDASDGKPDGDGPYRKEPGITPHDGAVYVVAGHGGTGVSGDADHPVMYFSEVENGSCVLDVHENRMTLINIRYDGAITDRVSIIKGDGLVIAYPDGGEQLDADAQIDVTWATVGDIPKVDLAYSLDDGESWTPIAAGVDNTGTYPWTVPPYDASEGLIRVSDASDPGVYDESNAGFATLASEPMDVIAFGDEWSYDDQGVDHGAAWLALGFDDSGWAKGPAQLGYGDGDEATELLDADPNHPSAYFRKIVDIDGEVGSASVEALYDDGIAVWINGVMVLGANVNDGTDYASFASGSDGDNAIINAPIAVDPSPFVDGANVVTAMVKQVDEGSSDLSFDLKLTVTVALKPPPGGTGGETDSGGETTGGTDGSAGTDGTSSAGTDGTSGAGTAGTSGPSSTGGLTTGVTGGSASGASASSGNDTAGIDDASGCACSTGGGGAPWLLLVAPVLWRRRRGSPGSSPA